ncbi:MAG: acyl transferase [Flavobacteriales bacterium]|nr:acyl transferase [Flavobacteriales bacterium]
MEQIFNIKSDEEFNEKALEIFYFQSENCDVYRSYLNLLGIHPKLITSVEKIPFFPVELFKTKKIFLGDDEPQLVFKSSGTTETGRSHHFVRHPIIYETSFNTAFELFYGKPENLAILCLLPSYLEQGESSLVYMMDHLVKRSHQELSGFYLNNGSELKSALEQCIQSNTPTLLIGVTYALLDFAETSPMDLSGITIMETGGMKGRRKEMIRMEVHDLLQSAFQVESIHSEYGMTELLSQAYSKGAGVFNCPPWMKIKLRQNTDPIYSASHLTSGMVNVIDLANVESCSFIATQDLGKIGEHGFEILGRTDHSDVRGCSQLSL